MNDIKKELAGDLARAYTTDRNSHKELDSILIEDMVAELIPIISGFLKEQRKVCAGIYYEKPYNYLSQSKYHRILNAPEPREIK